MYKDILVVLCRTVIFIILFILFINKNSFCITKTKVFFEIQMVLVYTILLLKIVKLIRNDIFRIIKTFQNSFAFYAIIYL